MDKTQLFSYIQLAKKSWIYRKCIADFWTLLGCRMVCWRASVATSQGIKEPAGRWCVYFGYLPAASKYIMACVYCRE